MSWSEEIIEQVWRKGAVIPNYDPRVWRRDACGTAMKRSEYGNRDSQYGWEIDHVNPNVPAYYRDSLTNLQPLQWENNVDKSDGRLKCKLRA